MRPVVPFFKKGFWEKVFGKGFLELENPLWIGVFEKGFLRPVVPFLKKGFWERVLGKGFLAPENPLWMGVFEEKFFMGKIYYY